MPTISSETLQAADGDWVSFPGGELQGRRPQRLCPSCQDARNDLAGMARTVRLESSRRATLCFQCYRLELDREKALKAAAELNTASDARFQFTLPWEPVDVRRLSTLRAARGAARLAAQGAEGGFAARRHRAQIAARHALQIAMGSLRPKPSETSGARALAGLSHAAELQLPESWLPFVVGRHRPVG
jgi:hypothetical protein